MTEVVGSGGCHCGAVRLTATFRPRAPAPGEAPRFVAFDCNCSICQRKGFLHAFVPRDRFVLLAGQAALQTYTFGTHTAQHRFCRTCGMHPFYVPRSHPRDFSVNVRCLDDAEVRAAFEIRPFDGQNWEQQVGQLPSA